MQKKILLQQIAVEISYKNKILQAVLFFHTQVFCFTYHEVIPQIAVAVWKKENKIQPIAMATIKNTRAFLVKNPAQGGGVLRKLPQPINLSYTNGKNVLWYPQGAGYPVVGWLLTPQVCCVTAQQAAYFIIVTLHGSLSKFCIDTANCGCNLEERKQSTTNCDGNNKKYARFFSQKILHRMAECFALYPNQ